MATRLYYFCGCKWARNKELQLEASLHFRRWLNERSRWGGLFALKRRTNGIEVKVYLLDSDIH
jgi:hypothetical protein